MVASRFAISLLLVVTVFPLLAQSAPVVEPVCVISDRGEILGEALQVYIGRGSDFPTIACEVGPWRTFRGETWEPSDVDWDFMESVALLSQNTFVPEPRGSVLVLSAIAALALAGRRRAGRAAR